MSKYLLTSGSHFEPFTYDDLVKPVAYRQQRHDAAVEEADAMTIKAGEIGAYLDESSPDTKALYDRYMNEYGQFINDLDRYGYTQKTGTDLSKLRRLFGVDMKKVQSVITGKAEAVRRYNDLLAKDGTSITSFDPTNLSYDEWLHNPYAGNFQSYSGAMLTTQASNIGENLKRDFQENPNAWKKILGEQYFSKNVFTGFHASEVNQAIDNIMNGREAQTERVKLLQSAMQNVYDSSGIGGWETPEARLRALKYIGDGIYSSIGEYKETNLQNRDFLDAKTRARMAGNGSTVVEPEIVRVRGNNMRFATGTEDKEFTAKSKIYDAVKILRDLKAGDGIEQNGVFTEAADRALDVLEKYDSEWQKISGGQRIRDLDLDSVVSRLEVELDEAGRLTHLYDLAGDAPAHQNIARNLFRINIGELSGKKDKVAESVARYSDGKGVKAKDLKTILDSDNVHVGLDARSGMLTVQKVGADNDKEIGTYDDRIIFLDPKAVLTGASAYANAAQLLYAADASLPEDISYSAREDLRKRLSLLANYGQTISLLELSDVLKRSYNDLMVHGDDNDRAVYNGLVEAFAKGLYDSSNNAGSPNNYRQGWSPKTGGASIGYDLEDLLGEE